MKTGSTKISDMNRIWPQVENYLSVPHSRSQYNKMVKLLDELIDEIGNDEKHPLTALMETIGTLIESYEEHHIPKPEKDTVSILKSLMAEHHLKQKDLKEIGSQGVVSEVLNGKRKLNLRQITALAQRFHISPDVLI